MILDDEMFEFATEKCHMLLRCKLETMLSLSRPSFLVFVCWETYACLNLLCVLYVIVIYLSPKLVLSRLHIVNGLRIEHLLQKQRNKP